VEKPSQKPNKAQAAANNESSKVCGIIKLGQTVKLNRSQAVIFHKLLSIRNYLPSGSCLSQS